MELRFNLPSDTDFTVFQEYGIDIRDALFFDIETTGFSAGNTTLYLIGAAYYDEKQQQFFGIQWFDETGENTKEILQDFFTFAQKYKILIHYNGDGFDLPYLQQAAQKSGIFNPLSSLTSFDFYKIIRPYKKMFALDHLKQKNIESFLKISRKDQMDGGKLIHVYQTYLKTKNPKDEESLLLHNRDDVAGLLAITPILHYPLIFTNPVHLMHLTTENGFARFLLQLDYPLKRRISFGENNILFRAYQNEGTLSIQVCSGELKYFYPNYKDYYYLPMEDTAIHKSVAFYVDKEYRTKAKASNCYSKKTGMFLPQTDPIVEPYFKKEYHEKTSYFELNKENLENYDMMCRYIKNVLEHLL